MKKLISKNTLYHFTTRWFYQTNHNDFVSLIRVRFSSNLHNHPWAVKDIKPVKDFNFQEWLVGVIDGDGSFVIRKHKNTYTFEFKISQKAYNLRLLCYINDQLKAGDIYNKPSKEGKEGKFLLNYYARTNKPIGKDDHKYRGYHFVVSRQAEILHHILPIFDNYPPRTGKKFYQYQAFKEAFMIKINKSLTTKQKNTRIEKIIAKRDKIIANVLWLNSPVVESLKHFPENALELLSKSWIVGFTEAEGSFFTESGQFYYSVAQYSDWLALKGIAFILGASAEPYIASKDGKHVGWQVAVGNDTVTPKVIDYFYGTLKGMKSTEYRVWVRGFVNNVNKAKGRKYTDKVQVKLFKLRHSIHPKIPRDEFIKYFNDKKDGKLNNWYLKNSRFTFFF